MLNSSPRLPKFFALTAVLAALASSAFADPAPVVVVTAGNTGGDVELKEDASALNGTFAHQGKDYNPAAITPLTAAGTSFTIWIRHRGGPYQLKGTPGGSQKEIVWSWDKPTEFTWSSFGTHTKDELGDSIVIITGAQPAPDSGIDAILIDPTNSFDPTKAKKEDLLKLATPTTK